MRMLDRQCSSIVTINLLLRIMAIMMVTIGGSIIGQISVCRHPGYRTIQVCSCHLSVHNVTIQYTTFVADNYDTVR